MSVTTSADPVTDEAPGPAETTATYPRVLGLDLSLASTGVAGRTWADTITGGTLSRNASRHEQWQRLRVLRGRLAGHIDKADLVVVEALPPSNYPGVHERAYLLWWVLGRCISREIPVAEVAPSQVKVYATGSGRASKEDVVQQVQRRRPDVLFKGNDQADALTLAAMGLDHLGYPPVVMPETHRRALVAVKWPEP